MVEASYIDNLIEKARVAQKAFESYSQEQVDALREDPDVLEAEGGSSSVFKSALNAPMESMCTSSMM